MDQPQPSATASPENDSALPRTLGGPLALQLKQEAQQSNFAGLRTYLARTREEHSWQDRALILDLVAPSFRAAALDFAIEAEPEAADLHLIRCAFYSNLAYAMRGKGTVDQVGEGSFRNSAQCIQSALVAYEKAHTLDPQDPTPCAVILPCLTIFGSLRQQQLQIFQTAVTLAPGLVPAFRVMVNSLSQRWYGTHEQSLQIARVATSKAGPANDMTACLFWAHILVETYYKSFDKNPKAATKHRSDSAVNNELNAAFDAWTGDKYTPLLSSPLYLNYAACWYYLVLDRPRLKRAMDLLGGVFSEMPWAFYGTARTLFDDAQQVANGKDPRPKIEGDPRERSLNAISQASDAIKDGKIDAAEKSLAAAAQFIPYLAPEQAPPLLILINLNLSQLRKKQGRDAESAQLREQAVALIDTGKASMEYGRFAHVTAHVLNQMGDYRRSLPYWDQAIRLSAADADPLALAGMFHNMGLCFHRIGLRDHAATLIRASVDQYRAHPGDPRLAAALLNLGNSLRHSAPVEAEACFNESAEFYVSRAQHLAACSTWISLGVLYGDHGRNSDALEIYQRVLKVRQQSPNPTPASLALPLNNIADRNRKMGRFQEAHDALDKALKLLPIGDPLRASAYNTRGKIFLDMGDDARAAEWLQKGIAEQAKRPSPDLAAMAENLETLLQVLERLPNQREIAAVQESLASVRAQLQAIPQTGGEFVPPPASMQGAVLLALSFGSTSPDAQRQVPALARSLAHSLPEETGYYSGRASLPDCTTLIFYGPDAEVLFRSLERALLEDPTCAGAEVTIRQGAFSRATVLPAPSVRLH